MIFSIKIRRTLLFVVFAAALAYANAGLIGAPLAAPVAHYSPASAVSSAYISQASPALAVAHAAPVVSSYAAHAPVVSTYAHAAPVATYAHAPVAIHAPAIGSSQQQVVRSLGGNAAVSTYSKAVDTAFSSVRKFDTRVTNDGLAVAHAPVVSTYAAHAPVVSTYAHAAPVVSSYSHAPVATYAHAAPVATYAHAGPVVSSYAAPAVVSKTAAVAYSPAAVVSHASFSGLGVNYGW